MKRKRILIIPWTISDGGGSERILFNVINLLKDKYDIDIFEIQRGEKKEFIDNLSDLEFSYLFFKKSEMDSISCKISRKLKFMTIKYFPNIVKKLYLKDNYDYVISFNYLYPSFLAVKLNAKKIMWLHGTIDNLATESRLKNLQKKALERADKIVSIASTTEESFIKLFPNLKDKSLIINNGFDVEMIRSKANEKIKVEYDVIGVGRLDENKNFEFLLKAVFLLKQEGIDIKLALCGDGVQKEQLMEVTKKLNITDNISILGYQSNPYKYIKNSKLVLLSSKEEGFSSVIVEGMILGKPFISTPVGGSKELSNDEKCGFIVNDERQMAKIIKKILLDENLYMEMNKDCLKMSQKYILEVQKTKLIKLLEDIYE